MNKTLRDMVAEWRKESIDNNLDDWERNVIEGCADELEAWAQAKAQEWRQRATFEYNLASVENKAWRAQRGNVFVECIGSIWPDDST